MKTCKFAIILLLALVSATFGVQAAPRPLNSKYADPDAKARLEKAFRGHSAEKRAQASKFKLLFVFGKTKNGKGGGWVIGANRVKCEDFGWVQLEDCCVWAPYEPKDSPNNAFTAKIARLHFAARIATVEEFRKGRVDKMTMFGVVYGH